MSSEDKEAEHEETLIDLRIAVARMGENIIFLEKTIKAMEKRNKEILAEISGLREIQECRFRWVVILFITLLMVFTGIVKVIPPL